MEEGESRKRRASGHNWAEEKGGRVLGQKESKGGRWSRESLLRFYEMVEVMCMFPHGCRGKPGETVGDDARKTARANSQGTCITCGESALCLVPLLVYDSSH